MDAVSTVEDSLKVGICMPSSIVSEVQGFDTVIKTDLGEVRFDKTAISNINHSVNSELSLGIEKVDSDLLTSAGSDDALYYLTLYSEDRDVAFGNADGSLTNGSATVTVPYSLGDTESCIVYTVDENGNETPIEAEYSEKDGTVSFRTSCFSLYRITAKKADIVRTLTFDVDEGEEIADYVRENGRKVVLPVCEKEGYHLAFWVAADGTKYEAGTEYEINADITLTAKWEPHTQFVWQMDKEATCTETGHESCICGICGKVLEERDIEALGHSFGEWAVTKEASCTVAGEERRDCLRCEQYETRITEVTIHTPELQNVKEASCTERGYTGDTVCSICGAILSEGEVIEVTAHAWNEWSVEIEATCQETGLELRFCEVCGETEERSIELAPHIPEQVNIKEANCIEDGYTGDTVCSVCGEILSEGEVIEATGHVWNEWGMKIEATCQASGLETRSCEVCGETEERIIEMLPHTPEQANEKEASCTKDGYTGDTVCSVCGEVLSEGKVIEATGHVWNEWSIVREATCQESGLETRFCEVCEEAEDRMIEILPHTPELMNAKEAGCTEAGYTGDTVCSVCGEILSEGEVIEATDHVWNEWSVEIEATCQEPGLETRSCEVCGEAEDRMIEILPHTPELTNAKEAGCTEAGYTGDTVCSVCGEILSEGEVIEATGHAWNGWYVEKEATCIEEGERKRTCSNCDAVESEEIAVLDHTYDEGVITQMPTADTDGEKLYTCTVCGVTRTESIKADITEIGKKKAELETAIGESVNLEKSNYTEASWTAYERALADAKAVLESEDATLESLEAAKEVLIKARGELVTKGAEALQEAKAELEKAKEAVKAVYDAGIRDYTETSWKAFIDAYHAAANAGVNATAEELQRLRQQLEQAKKQLVRKSSKDEPIKDNIKVGSIIKDEKLGDSYKVLSVASGTVEYAGPADRNTKSVKIPATITINGKTYQVISIAANALSGCSKLKKVTIGKNVVSIGAKAFYKCTNLTKITIPVKVAKIGKQAFFGCKKLKNIVIKTKKLTKKNVGKQAFKGIYEKVKIKVPKAKLKVYKSVLKARGIGKNAQIKLQN